MLPSQPFESHLPSLKLEARSVKLHASGIKPDQSRVKLGETKLKRDEKSVTLQPRRLTIDEKRLIGDPKRVKLDVICDNLAPFRACRRPQRRKSTVFMENLLLKELSSPDGRFSFEL